MVFAANNGDRGVANLVYDADYGSWSRASAQLPAESTAYGVSATYDDGDSFMAFQDHCDDHTIFVSQNDGTWISHESPGGSSANTPTVAILDGVLNVVFNSNNNNRDILRAGVYENNFVMYHGSYRIKYPDEVYFKDVPVLRAGPCLPLLLRFGYSATRY